MNQHRSRPLFYAVAALVLGCSGDNRATDDRPATTGGREPTTPVEFPDSLALTVPGGVEVWLTDWRRAQDTTGKACVERVMEIRRDGRRVPVPLLYTGSVPRLLNDSTMRASLWLNCQPGNSYDVDLRTGTPTVVPQ